MGWFRQDSLHCGDEVAGSYLPASLAALLIIFPTFWEVLAGGQNVRILRHSRAGPVLCGKNIWMFSASWHLVWLCSRHAADGKGVFDINLDKTRLKLMSIVCTCTSQASLVWQKASLGKFFSMLVQTCLHMPFQSSQSCSWWKYFCNIWNIFLLHRFEINLSLNRFEDIFIS